MLFRSAEHPTQRPTQQPTDEPTDEPTDQPTGPAGREREVRAAYASALVEAVRGRDVLLLPAHDADLSALPGLASAGAGAQALRSVLGTGLDVTGASDLLEDAGATVHETVWPFQGTWSQEQDAALRELPGGLDWGVLAPVTAIAGTPDGPVLGPTGAQLLPYDRDRKSVV